MCMRQTLSTQFFPDISIVIPTLGGDCLRDTIKTINSGTLIPKEILVCIPSSHGSSVDFLKSIANVQIVLTLEKGQVFQRSEGFKLATSEIVIQLDDDIQLEANAIRLLIEELLLLGPGNVVGPLLVDRGSLNPMHKIKEGLAGFIDNLFFTLVCGAKWGKERMGTITAAGIGFGVAPLSFDPKVIQCDWLPGGCVVSYRKELIFHNFYPFSGKAFYEDFIHSHLRSKNNKKHWVIGAAIGATDRAFRIQDKESFHKNRMARRYYVNLRGFSRSRLFLYETVELLKFFLF